MTIHAVVGGTRQMLPAALLAAWLVAGELPRHGPRAPHAPAPAAGSAPRGLDGRLVRDTSARAVCAPEGRVAHFPAELRESSGLAVSGRRPGVLWTHNDSGSDPQLFAVDSTGAMVSRVRVKGARNVDWEAVAQASCAEGSCLYVADIGDNLERRSEVVVYRVREPAPGDSVSDRARTLRFRYPGGPRDAEALAAAPGGGLYVISKGRGGAPPILYRLPAVSGSVPDVLQARRLLELEGGPLYATGAAVTPNGRWLAVRGYRSLRLFRLGADGILQAAEGDRATSLGALREPQGEAVAVRDDGVVFLTSEARGGLRGGLYRASCRFPGG